MSHALVIGAGPAGLMAADVLAAAGHRVTVADQMPSVGRKFLMAGKSGLNLTKAEPIETFLRGFGDVPEPFRAAVRAFGPEQVQRWAQDLGQTIFTGTTGRVFPQVMKASPLLRAWLARLDAAGVTVRTRTRWDGWSDDISLFNTPDASVRIPADVTVLALGGASWARLGSDGAWVKHLDPTTPFKPANCGFAVPWTAHMARFFGAPVKATALRSGPFASRGEWVITKRGIEGGGLYSVSAAIRDGAPLHIDLIPDLSLEDAQARLAAARRKMSRQQYLTKVLRMSPVKAGLFNEFVKGADVTSPTDLARAAKGIVLPALAPLPLDEAISTAGGVPFKVVNDAFMLSHRPGVFIAGEMLDWEAPTGGYLITGCLATGRAAGHGAVKWLERSL